MSPESVINNRKRHWDWDCAGTLLAELEKMEEAIQDDDENAKENFRQNALLIARMDVCEKHGNDYECSFEMVGFKEELQERGQNEKLFMSLQISSHPKCGVPVLTRDCRGRQGKNTSPQYSTQHGTAQHGIV